MNIKTILGKKKNNGEATVYFQFSLNGQEMCINTKISVDINQWDAKNGFIIGQTKAISDNNLIIQDCRARISDIYVKYRLLHKKINGKKFMLEYKNPTYDTDFLKWMEREIQEKKCEVGSRRIIKYHTVLNKIRQFQAEIIFSEVDHSFITRFRGWMKTTKKNDINTVSSNLAVLKSFTNRALKKKLIESDPFEDIKIGRGTGNRVYCTEDELEALWDIYNGDNLNDLLNVKKTLRHFLFMCMTGVRISDFSALSIDNLVNGMIFFCPIKTRAQKNLAVKVPLNDYALQLIEDEKRTSKRLFNPMAEPTMNKYLKDIARMANINKSLSNHSGRHTFATLFIKKTGNVAVLQKLLGHSRIEETMIYVHIDESDLISNMNSFSNSIQI